MSDLESVEKRKFPLRERQKASAKINLALAIKPSEYRAKSIQDFDREAPIQVPEDLQKIFEMAESFYNQGLDSKAYEYYLRYIGSGNYNPFYLFNSYKNIGNIKIRSGDLEGAEEFYHKAFTINPDSDVLLVNLGTLEIQKRNLEKALERYRMAVELNPLNPRGWVGLALAHREYGDHDLAWGNLERSLDIDPSDETSIELAVQWGIKDSRFDTLINRLTNYIVLNPNNLHMQIVLAKVLTVGGRLTAAQELVVESLKKQPDNSDLRNLLASLNQHIAGV